MVGKTSYLHNNFVVFRSNGVPELGTLLAAKGKVYKVNKLIFCTNSIKAKLATIENLDWVRAAILEA